MKWSAHKKLEGKSVLLRRDVTQGSFILFVHGRQYLHVIYVKVRERDKAE
jgi:hypothetical protein